MKAARATAIGVPSEVIKFFDGIEKHTPSEGNVLVKVALRPINPADLLFMEGENSLGVSCITNRISGRYSVAPGATPYAVGFEGVGSIESLGSGVTSLSVGERVSFMTLGSWAEYISIPAASCTVLPDDIR